MWARVAAFEGGDVERLREINERRMQEQGIPEPVKGVLILIAPDGSRQQLITTFESRDAMEQAEAMFEQMGDEIPEEVRGRRTSVDYYEVAYQQ